MAKLEFSLFGPFQVILNGSPVTQSESVKARGMAGRIMGECLAC
jgi:hypothetical protein